MNDLINDHSKKCTDKLEDLKQFICKKIDNNIEEVKNWHNEI